MTAPINIAATPVYRGTPPERWQEAASAYRRWWSRHPGLSSALNLVVRGAYALMIPLLIAALVMVPRLAYATVPAAFMAVCLMVVALLARTRTESSPQTYSEVRLIGIVGNGTHRMPEGTRT